MQNGLQKLCLNLLEKQNYKAYEAMSKSQDIEYVLTCARRYFAGECTTDPVWEILSNKNAKSVADISYILR